MFGPVECITTVLQFFMGAIYIALTFLVGRVLYAAVSGFIEALSERLR